MQTPSKFKESPSEINMEKDGAGASSSGADIEGMSNKNTSHLFPCAGDTLNSMQGIFVEGYMFFVSFKPSI